MQKVSCGESQGKAVQERLSEAIPPGCVEVEPSPDLTCLACIRDAPKPAQAGIWIVPVDGGEPRPVVTCQDVGRILEAEERVVLSRPRWSPDGCWIAFSSHEGMPPGSGHRLWAVRVDRGETCSMLYASEAIIAGYRWSPDGEHIALADSATGLIAIRRDEGRQVAADREAMRYPLGENGMAWRNDGRSLLYVNLLSGERGLWMMDVVSENREQVLALQEDEIAIPGQSAGGTWGTLVGNHRKPGEGLSLYVWQEPGEEPATYVLPEAEFDPASGLLPTADGMAWAFTVWREGRRVPCAICLPGGDVWEPEIPEYLDRPICWLEQPRRLLALISPLCFITLEPVWEPHDRDVG